MPGVDDRDEAARAPVAASAARGEAPPGAGLGAAADQRSATGPSASHDRRIEFLDALRGIAAFVVAVQHGAENLWPSHLKWSTEVFRPGEFGVVLFFLCSGFIIPVSIERYRSVGRFWIGRFFRLYPLYWFMIGGALVLHYWVLHRFELVPGFGTHWLRNIGANATMAQELTGHPLILGQSWTLAYELIFYLLVSLLFVARANDRPSRFAVGGFATAVVVGTAIPPRLLTEANPQRVLFVVGVTAVVCALAIRSSDRTPKAIATCVLLAGVAIPLLLNRAHHFWFDCLLLATMFTGSVLHRATVGRIAWRQAGAVVAVAIGAIVAAHLLWFQVDVVPGNGARTNWRAECLTFLAAYAIFGLGLGLRRSRFPRPLLVLGEISYSLYLAHGIVIRVVPWWGDDQWLTLARWTVASLAVSAITWRLVERPFQELGRKAARRAGKRWAPPPPLEPAPVPVA